MNFKKSYKEKYGYERIITDRNSVLTFAEADMLKLRGEDEYKIDEKALHGTTDARAGRICKKSADKGYGKLRLAAGHGISLHAVYIGCACRLERGILIQTA